MPAGKYFYYPDTPDFDITPQIGLIQAARSARAKQALEEDDAKRRWANLDRQNRLADVQIGPRPVSGLRGGAESSSWLGLMRLSFARAYTLSTRSFDSFR